MDLTLEDFTQSFLSSECYKVTLKTMGNKVVYLRGLSRADIVQFREIAHSIELRTALSLATEPEQTKPLEVRTAELEAAEDYLVFRTICDKKGTRLFTDEKHYKAWSQDAPNDAVEEIIQHINDNMSIKSDESEKHEKKSL